MSEKLVAPPPLFLADGRFLLDCRLLLELEDFPPFVVTADPFAAFASPDGAVGPETVNRLLELEDAALQIRLVRKAPSPETEELVLRTPGREETLHVDRQVLLDDTAIATASARNGQQGTSEIEITFTESRMRMSVVMQPTGQVFNISGRI